MKTLLLTLSMATLCLTFTAQISQGGEPTNWENKTVAPDVNYISLHPLDMGPIIAEDAVVDQYKETPYRYGIEKEVSYNVFEEGSYTLQDNGDRLWKLGIYSPNASSIKVKLLKMIYRQANTYMSAMKGTTFSVTDAILLIPPMIMIPTTIAKINPIMAPAAVLCSPSKSLSTIVA